MAHRGVKVSLNPTNMPCAADDRILAGAPRDLNRKCLAAKVSFRESYRDKQQGQFVTAVQVVTAVQGHPSDLHSRDFYQLKKFKKRQLRNLRI